MHMTARTDHCIFIIIMRSFLSFMADIVFRVVRAGYDAKE